MAAISFYILSTFLVLAALGVVVARNPVHSVLFLILSFFCAAGLFVLIGAEFLAMLLVVVYVGAVAVLFLFVVMMLDVDFAALKAGTLAYWPLAMLMGALLLGVMISVLTGGVLDTLPEPDAKGLAATNAEAIGAVMYTEYFLLFQLAGIVLLVAMIGAITLTLYHKPNVRRQNIATQMARRAEETVEMVDIKPGQGLSQ